MLKPSVGSVSLTYLALSSGGFRRYDVGDLLMLASSISVSPYSILAGTRLLWAITILCKIKIRQFHKNWKSYANAVYIQASINDSQ